MAYCRENEITSARGEYSPLCKPLRAGVAVIVLRLVCSSDKCGDWHGHRRSLYQGWCSSDKCGDCIGVAVAAAPQARSLQVKVLHSVYGPHSIEQQQHVCFNHTGSDRLSVEIMSHVRSRLLEAIDRAVAVCASISQQPERPPSLRLNQRHWHSVPVQVANDSECKPSRRFLKWPQGHQGHEIQAEAHNSQPPSLPFESASQLLCQGP